MFLRLIYLAYDMAGLRKWSAAGRAKRHTIAVYGLSGDVPRVVSDTAESSRRNVHREIKQHVGNKGEDVWRLIN